MVLVQAGKLTDDQARAYLESIRWPDGPKCPHCESKDVTRMTGEAHRSGVHQCNGCRGQFTVTTKSVMEDTHLPLQKWVMAFHLLCSSKKGISALQLQRQLGLGSYRTAWHLAHRIWHAMKEGPGGPTLQGVVEVGRGSELAACNDRTEDRRDHWSSRSQTLDYGPHFGNVQTARALPLRAPTRLAIADVVMNC